MSVDVVFLTLVSPVIISTRTSVPNEMSTPTSSSILVSEVSEKPNVHVDSDSEDIPKKKPRVASKIDTNEEQEHLSSTVKSIGSPPVRRYCRGLKDLKVVGTVSSKWSSVDDDDDRDVRPNIGTPGCTIRLIVIMCEQELSNNSTHSLK